jgi:plasmid stabilization system protein ParE
VPDVRIYFHPAAAAEVEAALLWYAERSPIAARAFATEVSACVERVKKAPERWPVICTVLAGASSRTFHSVLSTGFVARRSR